MILVEVAPIQKGIPFETLTYFSKDPLNIGDLVNVGLRSKLIKAIIINVHDLKDKKIDVKQSDFKTKKVESLIKANFVSKEIITIINLVSSYTLISAGKLFYDLLPYNYLERLIFEPVNNKLDYKEQSLQENFDNRVNMYKKIIRESLAKKHSVTIFCPTVNDAKLLFNLISPTISTHVLLWHGNLTSKEKNNFLDKLTSNKPFCVISTPSLMPYVLKNLNTIIVHEENSHYYFDYFASYDTRIFIKTAATIYRQTLIHSDDLLSLTNQIKIQAKEFEDILEPNYKLANLKTFELIDMHNDKNIFLSTKFIDILSHVNTHGGIIFVYNHRKGLYPTTICRDCNTIIRCKNCYKPLVLHNIQNIKTYVCHNCEYTERLTEDKIKTCVNCGGFRLETLGVGIQNIEKLLSKISIDYTYIDHENMTDALINRKLDDIYKLDKHIILGTEETLNILPSYDHVAIMSMDGLFSIPEPRNDERILSTIINISKKLKKRDDNIFLLQTRMPDLKIFEYIKSNNLLKWTRDELSLRRYLAETPYYVIVKAQFHNIDDNFQKEIEKVLTPFKIDWYSLGAGRHVAVLYIERETWFNNKIVRDRTRAVFAGFRAYVDAPNIFS